MPKTAKHTHTPGPWFRNIKPAYKYSVVFAGRNTHIAQVLYNRNEMSEAEIEANLDLIAAAPDLLKALKELAERCDGSEGVRADGSNIQTMQAHAAIRSAEGKEGR